MAKNAIALVPGYFGFDRVGEYTYWADRVLAGVRASVQSLLGPSQDITVVMLDTPGIGSLAERQRALVKNLVELDAKLCGPYVWHLVGHSTGGLDAALLLRTHALVDRESGSAFGPEALRIGATVGSVVTLATPHFGSTLALSDAASPTFTRRISLHGVESALETGFDLLFRRGGLNAPRVLFGLGAVREGCTLALLRNLLFNNRLALDLQPSVCAPLTLSGNRRDATPLHAIATFAPAPPEDYTDDRLFADLWRLTAEQANSDSALAHPPPKWPGSAEVIASSPATVPTAFLPTDNDGVVNTLRQWDGTPDSLAAVVVSDHADVLGMYRRSDPLSGKVINPGLLTSGANFGDDQFFRLCTSIGSLIAKHVR